MPAPRLNLGIDCTVAIIAPASLPLVQNHVTGFEASQIVERIRVNRCDGVQLGADLPKGWEGTFEIDRAGPGVDNFIAAAEAAWYSAGNPGAGGQLFQFINETLGGATTLLYSGCTFALMQAGTWRIDAPVKVRLSFWAATRMLM